MGWSDDQTGAPPPPHRPRAGRTGGGQSDAGTDQTGKSNKKSFQVVTVLPPGVYLLMSVKSGVLDFTKGMIHTFQWQKPLILQHDVDTDMSLRIDSSQ